MPRWISCGAGLFGCYYHICEFVVLFDTAEARFVAKEEHVRKYILHLQVSIYLRDSLLPYNAPPIVTKPFFMGNADD